MDNENCWPIEIKVVCWCKLGKLETLVIVSPMLIRENWFQQHVESKVEAELAKQRELVEFTITREETTVSELVNYKDARSLFTCKLAEVQARLLAWFDEEKAK